MPRDRGNRDHYDRPSWSDIDKRRRSSSSGSRPSGPPEGGREPNRYQKKQRDAKFESLFSDPKKESALTKVRQEVGKDGFAAALDAYREAHGLPESFDLLQVTLESHPDAAVRTEALQAMDAVVDGQADPTKQVFRTRVKLLALTARELPLKKLAARIAKARGY